VAGQDRAGIVIGPPKAGSREIALGDVMSAVLAEHRAEQDAERAAAGDAWVETGLVYVNADGAAEPGLRELATSSALPPRLFR
jgi:hypothetical protein